MTGAPWIEQKARRVEADLRRQSDNGRFPNAKAEMSGADCWAVADLIKALVVELERARSK